jgi:hypothetical protein
VIAVGLRIRLLALLPLAATLAVASTAGAAPPSLTLTPTSVERGHRVAIKGSADGCVVGDTVSVLSHAFVHTHDFAGVPAVYAKVRAGGLFRTTTVIPVTRAPGTYTLTARCGGGNLGVLKHLRVHA